MPDHAVRLGVVGLGRAATLSMSAFANHPDIRITACADPNEAARTGFASRYQCAAFATDDAMLRATNLDAVYIATPHQDHRRASVAALRSGVHVMVEKPMAVTLEDCRAMVAASESARRVLMVGHTQAFSPAVQEMAGLVRSGTLGALRMITNLVYGDFLYRPRRPEELDTDAGGGIFFNQVPHQVDIVRSLCDAPVRSVRAVAGRWDPDRATEGALSALLTFDDGTVANLTYSGYDGFDSDELHFWIAESGELKPAPAYGSARRALLAQPDEAALVASRGYAEAGTRMPRGTPAQPHFGFLLASCTRGDLRPSPQGVFVYTADGVSERTLPAGRSFPNRDAMAEAFVAAIRGGACKHDAHWGLETMRVTHALLQSASEDREVRLADFAITNHPIGSDAP